MKIFHQLKNDAIIKLEKEGFKVDYLELAKSKNLNIVDDIDKAEGADNFNCGFSKQCKIDR